ncbi:MAG: transporter substrate-binding domain-containing protein [Alphaproteobacteria bacterium]|nr:transporter substrate-binding domain-containing protein [Alphaproteobacteria bacterium]
MKKPVILFLVIFATLLSLKFYIIQNEGEEGRTLAAQAGISSAHAADKQKETVYDRVMRTGKIRCGYVAHDPYVVIDPNTTKKSGIMHDVMEEIGRRQGFEIEWTAEVGWADFITGLEYGHYDILCSGGWNSANEGKLIGYTKPVYFQGIGIWVRTDDMRFDDHKELLNSPDVTVASGDGSLVSVIGQTDFPQAKILSLPNLNMATDFMQMVAMKKADVTFLSVYTGNRFIQNNPGTLKNIATETPIRVFPTSFIIPHDDYRLQQTLNAAIDELTYSGFIDRVLDRYESGIPGSFYRVAKPYAVPGK